MLDKQVSYDEAALTFSGPRALTAHEVVEAIVVRAVGRKQLEVLVAPSGSGRGSLAKLVGLFPGLAELARTRMAAKGRQKQLGRR